MNIRPSQVAVVAFIVIAGGISGTWFQAQMPHDSLLAVLGWGWWAAILAEYGVLTGVNRAVKGDRWGWAVLGMTGIAVIVMDISFFAGGDHPFLVAVALGLFPTVSAVLLKTADAREQRDITQQRDAQDALTRQRQQQIEDETRHFEQEKELLRLKAELRATLPRATTPPPQHNTRHNAPSNAPSMRQRAFAILTERPNISNPDLAAEIGSDEATARGYKSAFNRLARDPEPVPITANGNGHHPD